MTQSTILGANFFVPSHDLVQIPGDQLKSYVKKNLALSISEKLIEEELIETVEVYDPEKDGHNYISKVAILSVREYQRLKRIEKEIETMNKF